MNVYTENLVVTMVKVSVRCVILEEDESDGVGDDALPAAYVVTLQPGVLPWNTKQDVYTHNTRAQLDQGADRMVVTHVMLRPWRNTALCQVSCHSNEGTIHRGPWEHYRRIRGRYDAETNHRGPWEQTTLFYIYKFFFLKHKT